MTSRTNDTIAVSSALPAMDTPPPDASIPAFDADAYTKARIREGLAQKFNLMFAEAMRETDWSRVRPENAAAVAQVRDWAPKPGGKGLLLTGPTGRLKTRAMVSLIGRLMTEDGKDVAAYKANDWFFKLQGRISYGRDEAAGWVRAVAQRPIVFIDDLGQQAVMHSRAEWAEGWWFDFCDQRIEAGLPLLVTTNLNAREMAQSQNEVRGDPLLRRLLELCEPVKFV
jgi:DNA replication protein DnaC